jgi:ubiquinone/menaquinone biosynthesis C-methylase UbiE
MTTTSGNVTQFTEVDGAPDASWFISFMDRANAMPEYDRISESLAAGLGPLPGATVLDVGCGTGDDARALAARVGDGRVVAVDLSEAMVDEARSRAEGSGLPIDFRVADLRQLDFADGTFDGVRAKLVLMHCDDVDAAAGELLRVTRPGGRISVFDYDFDTATIDHPDVDATREVVRCCSDGHPNRWMGRQMRRRFLDLGLSEVSVTPHTVVMPFSFFRMSVAGRLAAAQAHGALKLSADELRIWWQALIDAEERGEFFTSLTGFTVAATR